MAASNVITSSDFRANSTVTIKFYDALTGAFLKEVPVVVKPSGFMSYQTTEFVNGEKAVLSGTDNRGLAKTVEVKLNDYTPPKIEATVDSKGSSVYGTSEPGATIQIKTTPDGVLLGTAIVGQDGTYSVTLQTPLVNGEKIEAVATDASGNYAAKSLVAPDITPPAPPENLDVVDKGLAVIGTAEANSIITIRNAVGDEIGIGVTDANGNFKVSISPAQINKEALTATATDSGPNESQKAPFNAHDLTPPDAPVNVVISKDGLTVTGDAEALTTIKILDASGKTIGTGVTDANGHFSVVVSPAQNNGQTITLTATDASTNESLPATASSVNEAPVISAAVVDDNGLIITGKVSEASTVVIKNAAGIVVGTGSTDATGAFNITLAPAQITGEKLTVVATDLATPPLSSAPFEAATKDSTPPAAPTDLHVVDGGTFVTGKAEPNSTITIKDPSGQPIGSAVTDVNGDFKVPVSPAQNNGETLTAIATDKAGNPSDPSTVLADNAVPVISNAAVDLAGVTITGQVSEASTVVVKNAAGVVVGTGTTDANGAFSFTLSPAQNAGGVLTIVATDKAPVPANSLPYQLDVSDTTPPEAPTDLAINPEGTVVTGKAEPNSTITVKDPAGNTIGTGTTDANGDFKVPVSPAQNNGQTLDVIATDAAKNPSLPSEVTASNAAPVITSAEVNGLGTAILGQVTEAATIVVKNAAGVVVGSGATDANGSFAFALNPAQVDGSKLTIVATDVSVDHLPSAGFEVATPDLTPPDLSSAKFNAEGTQISGEAEANSTITVKDSANKTIGSAITDASGHYTVILDKAYGLGEIVKVTATDAMGNDSLPKNATAPILTHANNDVAQADVDLAFTTTSSSYTETKSFGSVVKFLGIPILGCNTTEINFNVGETQKTTVDISATNFGLASLFDAVKVTLYKQNADGSWAKVVSNTDWGLFNKFFLFFPEQARITSQNLPVGNYKVVAEDLTAFSILSLNSLNVKYTTETKSANLDVSKVNVLEGDVLLNDVGAGKVVTKITNADGKTVDVTATGTTLVGKYGTIVIEADGSYKYTANKDIKVVGQVDQFTYTIKDANGNTSQAKVFVQINSNEVKLTWDPTDPSKPATSLALQNDTDSVHTNLYKASNVSTSNVDSGYLTATYGKSSTVASSAFTVADKSSSVVHVSVKGGYETGLFGTQYKTYQDADDTTFTWQLQRYNSTTKQWENVSGQSGSKYFDKYCNTVYTGCELFGADVKVTEPGQYRVNFTATTGKYGWFSAQEFDTDVSVKTTTQTDNWYLEAYGKTSGNIFTGVGTDSAAVDSLGVLAKTLSISVDGGKTFVDVSSSGTSVQGTFGKLTITADGNYSYQHNGDNMTYDNFVYKVKLANGETQTANLTIHEENAVHGTAYADNFTSNAVQHILELGAGADTVKFSALNAYDNHPDAWVDFKTAEGDKLDVSTLLAGKGVTSANIGDYVSVTQDGTASVVKIDLDGKGTDYAAKDLIVLQNNTLNLNDLLQGGHIIF